MSGGQLASELELDKSVISLWLRGSIHPSAHNLALLSSLIATRVKGFSTLDWERDRESLIEMFSPDPRVTGGGRPGLPIAIWEQMLATASLRGSAYESIFRSTRASQSHPGRYIHDHGMIRRDEIGLLRLTMGSGGTVVEGWMLPLHNQLFSIAADTTSGVLLFGIFNGVGTAKVDVFDGLSLTPGLDAGRTPTAMVMLCERVCDLSDDREADDRRLAELLSVSPLAPEGSIPEHVQKHLVRDVGPMQLALGGDWLVDLPLSRSMARGRLSGEPLKA